MEAKKSTHSLLCTNDFKNASSTPNWHKRDYLAHTVEPRYLELGFLELCGTRSVYLFTCFRDAGLGIKDANCTFFSAAV